MKRARYLPAAVRDLDEITEKIAEYNLDAAIRFCDVLQTDASRLAEFPGLGTRRDFDVPELEKMRSWPLKGYRNYLVFFVPADHGIDVVRIIHGARNLEALFRDP